MRCAVQPRRALVAGGFGVGMWCASLASMAEFGSYLFCRLELINLLRTRV
jgi:hypothetical protein